jgi:hypothetical protein
MSSPAQIAANQANAMLSTGPTTPEGKSASSQNNVKYGLTCRTFRVRSGESQEDFATYANALITYYQPANIVEDTLVRKMAQHHLCSQRAILAQECCFVQEQGAALCTVPEQQRELALYLRYQGEHDRAFHKCRQEMDKNPSCPQSRTGQTGTGRSSSRNNQVKAGSRSIPHRKTPAHRIRSARVRRSTGSGSRLHPRGRLKRDVRGS